MDYRLIPADGYHSDLPGRLACTRASHQLFRAMRRSGTGRKFCGRHGRLRYQTWPSHARSGQEENGGESAERRIRRRRRSETEVSSVVDGTCIRWIAASFGNPRGRPPSCSPTYPLPASPMSCHSFA